MKTLNSFFLIILTLHCVSSLELTLPVFKDTIKHDFNAILIQLHSSETVTNLDQLIEKINEFADEADENTATADSSLRKAEKKVKEEVEFRNQEIQAALRALTNATEAKTKVEETLKNIEEIIPQIRTEIQIYENQKLDAKIKREKEHEDYKKLIEQYKQALKLLDDLKIKLNFVKEEFVPKSSFQAFSFSLFAQMTRDTFDHMLEMGHGQHFAQIYSRLSSTPKNFEENHLRVTLDSIGGLYDKLEKARREDMDLESQRELDYKELVRMLNVLIEELEVLIGRLTNKKLELEKAVNEENRVIDSATKKEIRNTDLKNDVENLYNSFIIEFKQVMGGKFTSVSSVQAVIDIVSKRKADFPESLSKRLKDVKEKVNLYSNETRFIPFEKFDSKSKRNIQKRTE